MSRIFSLATTLSLLAAPSIAPAQLTVPQAAQPSPTVVSTPMVVLGFNDLGMHCMNPDYSEIMILPPFNNLHAQVIQRREEPRIITSGVTVRYVTPGNTHAADKSNFWKYAEQLFGVALQPNVGLTGNGMAGTMQPTGANYWAATGIPIVPTDDTGRDNPYPLASIVVMQTGQVVARTQVVVPVSTELSCHLCHNNPGVSTATDIINDHDRLHGTHLNDHRPVRCALCHSDNALGMPGNPELPSLSAAMHGAHASRMAGIDLQESCYACHPGVRTQCQRDVHFARGKNCTFCHGGMVEVGNPARRPWIDEPRCGNCHTRSGFSFEESGKLYRESKGHAGVHCAACHGSPHAITPTITEVDNIQSVQMQGLTGVIRTCTVCHTSVPGSFFHSIHD